MLRRSRRHGFGVNLADVVPGINAFGVPLFDAERRPFASISVVGPVATMPRTRLGEFEAMLRAEAARIESDTSPPF
jgi:DNA-binding IclR family transcriptional regulator